MKYRVIRTVWQIVEAENEDDAWEKSLEIEDKDWYFVDQQIEPEEI